jgi:hypothetical protein
VYKQILIDVKLKTGKRGNKTDLTGISPLRTLMPSKKKKKKKNKTYVSWICCSLQFLLHRGLF